MRVIGACVSLAHEFEIRRAQIEADDECDSRALDTTHTQIEALESEARRAIAAYDLHRAVMRDLASRRTNEGHGGLDKTAASTECKPGKKYLVLEGHEKLIGRFGIVLPRSQEVILFGKGRLWKRKADAEFHLQHRRGYVDGQSGLHSAYVGELGKDFWLEKRAPQRHRKTSSP